MHDAKGRELKVGDICLIPVRIKNLQAFDDYCNSDFESVYGRRPDGAKEHFSAINTGVVLRANPGDDLQVIDGKNVTVGTTVEIPPPPEATVA